MKLLIGVSIVLFSSCTSVKNNTVSTNMPCTAANARAAADKLFARQSKSLELSTTLTETDSTYVVELVPVDKYTVGGGRKVTISKRTCRIIQAQRYQ
jgi:hypothetical protein